VIDKSSSAPVFEASDLALKAKFYNQVGLFCIDYSVGGFVTCGCAAGHCQNGGECGVTTTGAFCQCQTGFTGFQYEAIDTINLPHANEGTSRGTCRTSKIRHHWV
jgi:hypothetical protein